MLLNYLKLAVRLLVRSPFFTFINITGLSVGFATFLILWQYSTYELESDRYHKDYESIFRVYCDFRFAEGSTWTHYIYSTIPPVLAQLVKEKNKDIKDLTRLIHQKNFDAIKWRGPQTDTAGFFEYDTEITMSYIDDREERSSFKETRCAFADPNFFQFFSVPLISGQPRNVLGRADAVVISESTSVKYFGNEDPVGKVLFMNGKESFTVTGVFQDFGNNTHLNSDLFFSTLHIPSSMESTDPFQETSVSYYKLASDADISNIEKTIDAECGLHWNFQEPFPGSVFEFHLQPLEEAPFEIFENDAYVPESKLKLNVFLIVGIVVLVMAWINYLNLQLSTQAKRMKELAARKTAGARRGDFVKQFLVESLIINVLSVLVALTIIQLTKTPLQVLFQLSLPDWSELKVQTVLIFLVAMMLGILIACLHPAVSMWRLTIRDLLNFGRIFGHGRNFTKITSVTQFFIAIVLMVWLSGVFSQVNYVLSSSWGIDRDRVLVIELPSNDSIIGKNDPVEKLKTDLLNTAGVEDVTFSRTVAGDLVRNRVGFWRNDTSIYTVPKSDGGVDERFIPFYKLEILAGRNFVRDNPADKNAVILSREAAANAGWKPEEAIGKIVSVEKYPWRPFLTKAEIIGVIEDHRSSPMYLQSSMAATNRGGILTYRNDLFPNNQPERLSVRLQAPTDVLGTLKEKYDDIFPGKLFHWYFLDDHMNTHYQAEQIARNQIMLFTSLAIGIACLGLLGVISNKVVSKTKEIGIRKILGAQLHQIGQILLSATLSQFGIAIVIATPVAYLLTQSYLEKFSHRITLQWWHFMAPVTILLVIMLLSVASVVFKAATRNPVVALKRE